MLFFWPFIYVTILCLFLLFQSFSGLLPSLEILFIPFWTIFYLFLLLSLKFGIKFLQIPLKPFHHLPSDYRAAIQFRALPSKLPHTVV